MKSSYFLLILLTFALGWQACTSAGGQSDPELEKAIAEGRIYWMDIETAEKKAKQQPKKVLVDAYTDWCGWCKKMDKATFEHPDIVKYVNDNFYAVKYNAETKTPIEFKGETYNFVQGGRRGYNELTNVLLKGRRGYPTISFLDEKMEMINAFPGFKTPDKFDPILHYVNDGAYKTKSLNEFEMNFKTSIAEPVSASGSKEGLKIKQTGRKKSVVNTATDNNNRIQINKEDLQRQIQQQNAKVKALKKVELKKQ